MHSTRRLRPVASATELRGERDPPYRPHVRADQRLRTWTAPSSLSTPLHSLNSHTIDVILEALEPATRKNYGTGLLRYAQFCDRARIPEHERVPASETVLSNFIAAHAGSVSRSTIDT